VPCPIVDPPSATRVAAFGYVLAAGSVEQEVPPPDAPAPATQVTADRLLLREAIGLTMALRGKRQRTGMP